MSEIALEKQQHIKNCGNVIYKPEL